MFWIAPAVKSVVLAVDTPLGAEVWLLLVRGDHELNEVKAGKVEGLKEGFRFATVSIPYFSGEGLEAVRHTKDGRRIEVSLTISPIWDAAGQIVATSIIARDITARKATQAALATSLELFRVAFANAPIGLVLTDPDLNAVQINPAMCTMLGYTEEELISMDIWEWTHPDDRQANRDAIAVALAGGTSKYELEKRYLHRDGHIVWGHLRGSLVRDADGAPRYFVSQTEDITARKAAESALAASEERFRVAFEDAAIGMAIVRPDQQVLRVNRASCVILGYSEEELLGTTLLDITHPDDVAANGDLMARALAGEFSSFEMEKRYIRKDGAVVTVQLCSSLLRYADGTPRYFLSQIQDITARKAAEAEFTATHLRMQQVLERISDGFYALDRDWRFTYVNPAMEQILGRTRDDLLGQSAWEAFPTARETQVRDFYQQVLRDGKPTALELYYPPFDGWFEVRLYPSEDGLAIFVRNVSDQRKFLHDLQVSEATFRTLVEQLPLVVYLLEADDEQTPRYFSPRYELITGFTVEEAIHRTAHWLTFVHPEDHDRVAAVFAESQAAQTPFSADYRYIRKDGEVRWIRHAEGIPSSEGMFRYWTIHGMEDPVLGQYLADWIARELPRYTGMINIETIGGRIIEAQIRFADQWCDLYGRDWFKAVVALYGEGRWPLVEDTVRRGYSVPLFARHGHVPPHPPEEVQAAIRTMPNVSSLQITYHPQQPGEAHPMPPGGFRLGIVNGWDLPDLFSARRALAAAFPGMEMLEL